MDVNPYEFPAQNPYDRISLLILRRHRGNHHIEALVHQETGDFGNPPIVFLTRLRTESQIGTERGTQFVGIQMDHRDGRILQPAA